MGGAGQRAGSPLSGGHPVATALLGGSFNPAHGGHRRITRLALATLGLDEAWWLVSPGNPLKPVDGMAGLETRVASARRQARHVPIRVTAIEQELGTRYTADTLAELVRRYPKRRFVWLMGADNLAQFDRWREWRRIARTMPIAVIARPGYDGAALASPAMAWLGRYRRPVASLLDRKGWRAPTLVLLRFEPDPRSASRLRVRDPDWALRVHGKAGRDDVTHRFIQKVGR